MTRQTCVGSPRVARHFAPKVVGYWLNETDLTADSVPRT